MKIRITTLPPHGLPVQFEIEPGALNERLAEGRESDITFTTGAKVDVRATPITGAVSISGKVDSQVRQACAGCGTLHERSLTVPVEWMVRPKQGQEGEEDDIGLYYYEGDHFDLESPIAEACLLQLTPYWRPELTGEEPCSVCTTRQTPSEPQPTVSSPKTNSLAAAMERAKATNASKRRA